MGLLTVNEAVKALCDAGLRAGRGYPGAVMPQIGALAVAVNVERAEEKEVTLAAMVCCPGAMGSVACEDGAEQVAAAWATAGGTCIRERCTYEGHSDLFSVRVLGTWVVEPEPKPVMSAQVALDGRVLAYVTKVRTEVEARWVQSEPGSMGEDPEASLQEQRWTVTVEELLPSRTELVEPASPFVLTVKEGGQLEQYSNCSWMSVLREDTTEGVRQVRVCQARTRGVTGNG